MRTVVLDTTKDLPETAMKWHIGFDTLATFLENSGYGKILGFRVLVDDECPELNRPVIEVLEDIPNQEDRMVTRRRLYYDTFKLEYREES